MIGLFAEKEQITDLPEFCYLRASTIHQDNQADRTYSSVQGLGGCKGSPFSGFRETNLLRNAGNAGYEGESILVHEFGHHIHGLCVDDMKCTRVESIYNDYKNAGKFDLTHYMFVDVHEFFAVCLEAWFESTNRTDINNGINTKALLKEKIPEMAQIFTEIFAVHENNWKYTDDLPGGKF